MAFLGYVAQETRSPGHESEIVLGTINCEKTETPLDVFIVEKLLEYCNYTAGNVLGTIKNQNRA